MKPTEIIQNPSPQKTAETLSTESRASVPDCPLGSGDSKWAEFFAEKVVYNVQPTVQKLSGAVQIPSFISSYPTCRFSLFISLSLSCELDTLPTVVRSLLLAGCEKPLWARETGGTSETGRVRGPKLEVFGTSNPEPRTTDRAFLACLARHAPRCVFWRSFSASC